MPNQLAVLEQAKSTLVDLGIKFGPKVVVAILILVAGFYAGRWIGAVFDRWLSKLKLEPPASTIRRPCGRCESSAAHRHFALFQSFVSRTRRLSHAVTGRT